MNGINLTIEDIKTILCRSLKVIKLYDWFLSLYILDFFTEDHWHKLPRSWQECLQNIDPQELGLVIAGAQAKHVLPLSVLSMLKFTNSFAIPRKPTLGNDTRLNKIDHIHSSHHKFQNLFTKHVKLKKRHEIQFMTEVVVDIAKKTNCMAVIDFGSGLGHLVRVLAYKHNLWAAGIDCQKQLTEEARKLDLELEYTARKHLSEHEICSLRRPEHLNLTLSSESQLLNIKVPFTVDGYGLVGLHPCGDLGPLLLRHFVNNTHVKFICLVGCCYMKLTSDDEKNGYPMSNYLSKYDCTLSHESREIACHAIEVYSERLRQGRYEDLKIHAYRAALEKILVKHDPKLKHMQVRSVKHTEGMNFQEYCTKALDKINVSLLISQELLSSATTDISQWRKVVIVYTLRLALAPLVETVILLDRVLYVLENGLSCFIQPVFDPKISPRNHIIVATK